MINKKNYNSGKYKKKPDESNHYAKRGYLDRTIKYKTIQFAFNNKNIFILIILLSFNCGKKLKTCFNIKQYKI